MVQDQVIVDQYANKMVVDRQKYKQKYMATMTFTTSIQRPYTLKKTIQGQLFTSIISNFTLI